jgi:hypothetical protein
MPEGLVRSGDYRNGTPITLPHQFGTPVGSNEPFGNVQPQSNPQTPGKGNPVTWLPSPAHFGNQVSFSLQTVPPVVVIARGLTGTTDIDLTNLKGSNAATLTSFGEPAGVAVAFAPNPDTGVTVATITVGSSVPVGKYTITVVGTVVSPNIEFTQIHLVVVSAGVTRLATPVATPAGGSYTGAQTVTLTLDPNATATYYTTDGSTPTTGSTLYTGPITTTGSGTETIKAFSHGTGAYSDSAVMTDVYVISASTSPVLIAKGSAATNGSFAGTITSPVLNTTGATVLIAIASQFGGSYPISFTDSLGNDWHVLPVVSGGGVSAPQIAYAYQGPGGIGPVLVGAGHTAVAVSAGGDIALTFMAWSGVLSASDPFESYSDAASSATLTTQPGSVSAVASGDLIISGLGGLNLTGPASINESFVYNADFIGSTDGIASAYLVAPSTSPVDPTWTIAANGNRMIANIAVFAHA